MSILRKLAGFEDENKKNMPKPRANKVEYQVEYEVKEPKAIDGVNWQGQKHCSQCGSVISKTDKFCGGCGAGVTVKKSMVETIGISKVNKFKKIINTSQVANMSVEKGKETIMKNKKTQLKFFIRFLILGLCFFVIFLFFESDIYIKYTFNKAFNYRLAGDCTSFKGYLVKDVNNWNESCEREKNIHNFIDGFEIQNIFHNIGHKNASLQVELSHKGKKYSVNYKIIRQGLLWKINENKEALYRN